MHHPGSTGINIFLSFIYFCMAFASGANILEPNHRTFVTTTSLVGPSNKNEFPYVITMPTLYYSNNTFLVLSFIYSIFRFS